MQRIALLLSLLLFGGCQSLSTHRIRAENHDDMTLAISHRIPTGTSLITARKTMEDAGFECDLLTSASFSEDPGYIGDEREYKSIRNARYLSCRRIESAGFLVSHIWSVAIVIDEEDHVEDVLVLHRMDGP